MANATGSAANLDLALHLGPSRHAAGLALDLQLGPPHHAAGLDLQLGPPGSDAGRGRGRDLDMERFAGSELLVESVGASPARNPVQVVQQPLLPWAGRGAHQHRRRWADLHAARVPAMNPDNNVPAWVRRGLQHIYDLPENQPLYYIGKKVLSKSDVNSPQARFLVPASAARRIGRLLTRYEIVSAGFHRNYRQIRRNPGERASPTRYPGVAVSVYVSSGKWWSMSDLKLRKFHRSDGTVINGMGYRGFMENCGMVVGDGIELWAFRRSPYRLCFVMAK